MIKLSKEMAGVDLYGNKGTVIHLNSSGVSFVYKADLMTPKITPPSKVGMKETLSITTEILVKFLEVKKFDPDNYFGVSKKEIIAYYVNQHRSHAVTREKFEDFCSMPYEEIFEFDYLSTDGKHEKLSVHDVIEFLNRNLVEVG